MGAGSVILRHAIFIDLDGVVIQNFVVEGRPKSYSSIEETFILEGVKEALERSRAFGFLNIVFTNQPEVSRGNVSLDSLNKIHEHLTTTLAIDQIFMCPHDDSDLCQCRKPLPGMLLAAQEVLGIDLGASYVVGDRWRDISAGQAVGVSCFHIDYGYDEAMPTGEFVSVKNLADAVDRIVSMRSYE
jgi:D-glycero-D-manno-heptose 1,7-bisphosphate phosphatase